MTTPEGKVKAKVRKLLDHPNIWSFWPVPSGYQAATLDVLCVVRVRDMPVFFAIEVKRPGEKPTARQRLLMDDLKERVGACTFAVDGDESLKELEQWLEQWIV